MVEAVRHPTYGLIMYKESFWTGKKNIKIDGKELRREKRNRFIYEAEDGIKVVKVEGNQLFGIRLVIAGEKIKVARGASLIEVICSVLLFVAIAVWGNNVYLCSIVPIVGGAIGGGVAGLMAALNLFAMRASKNFVGKLLVWIGMLIATFLICFLIALVFFSLLAIIVT